MSPAILFGERLKVLWNEDLFELGVRDPRVLTDRHPLVRILGLRLAGGAGADLIGQPAEHGRADVPDIRGGPPLRRSVAIGILLRSGLFLRGWNDARVHDERVLAPARDHRYGKRQDDDAFLSSHITS